jgi:hypothetical protein
VRTTLFGKMMRMSSGAILRLISTVFGKMMRMSSGAIPSGDSLPPIGEISPCVIRSSHSGLDEEFSCEIMPRRLVYMYQRFGRFYCLHPQGGASRDWCICTIVSVRTLASIYRLTKVIFFYYPEGRGRKFLRNIGTYGAVYKAVISCCIDLQRIHEHNGNIRMPIK